MFFADTHTHTHIDGLKRLTLPCAHAHRVINAIIEAPPPQFIFFYFLLQIRRSLRLSVCAFCIRVEALYTLKHHPAESVISDFFHCGPYLKASLGVKGLTIFTVIIASPILPLSQTDMAAVLLRVNCGRHAETSDSGATQIRFLYAVES